MNSSSAFCEVGKRYPHVTKRETEAQRGKNDSHKSVVKLDWNPGFSVFLPLCFSWKISLPQAINHSTQQIHLQKGVGTAPHTLKQLQEVGESLFEAAGGGHHVTLKKKNQRSIRFSDVIQPHMLLDRYAAGPVSCPSCFLPVP